MISKTHVMEAIERERDYLVGQTIGTDEYNASQARLMSLEKTLFEMEKSEIEAERKQQEMTDGKKSQIISHVLEGIKVVGGGIILPLVGLVWITATEKDTTFTGALRDYTKYFLPKK